MKNNSHPKPLGILLAFLLTFGSSIFTGFLVSILISKSYWGYYFSPPELPQKVEEFDKIRSITPVSSIKKNDGARTFKIDTSISCIKDIQLGTESLKSSCGTGKCNTEYCDSSRIVLSLSNKGKLAQKIPYISPDKLNSLYNNLEKTELLYKGEAGYNGELTSDDASGQLISKGDGKRLQGVVVEAEDKNKQAYLFVAVNGGQVSNDHYPYYEFLFEIPKKESNPKLISHNRFFYEVAGLEDILVWHNMWIVLSVIGFILSIPVTYLIIQVKLSLKAGKQTASTEQSTESIKYLPASTEQLTENIKYLPASSEQLTETSEQ